MTRDYEYEANNVGYDKDDGEEGIKCKNHIVCDVVLPKWRYDCKGCYFCINCLVLGWGNLRTFLEMECPICLDVNTVITRPTCEQHPICVSCFKWCYYGVRENEPKFTYPEVEGEYFDDQDNPKWDSEYPLMRTYNKEWNDWEDSREYKNQTEQNLRNCHYCRK
jgi:hypothetical protein